MIFGFIIGFLSLIVGIVYWGRYASVTETKGTLVEDQEEFLCLEVFFNEEVQEILLEKTPDVIELYDINGYDEKYPLYLEQAADRLVVQVIDDKFKHKIKRSLQTGGIILGFSAFSIMLSLIITGIRIS